MRYTSRYASSAPKRSSSAYRYQPKPSRRPIPPVAFLAVAVVVLVAAVVGGIALINPGRPSGGGAAGGGEINLSGKIHSGVTIDGVAVGGLTAEDARAKLADEQKQRAGKVAVTITDGSAKMTFDSREIKVSFDTDSVLSSALSMNAGGALKTSVVVDYANLETQVRDYAASLSHAPVNAMVLNFDPTKPQGQQFTCSGDLPGVAVDADALWADVKKQLDDGTYGTVQAKSQTVQASATKDWIEHSMKPIYTFTTVMKDHSKPRLTNIRLAAAKVSGNLILPGQTLSVNTATGPRTAAQGYQQAHVINAGVEDNGLGGGVCQVSGTLFNAAVRAGVEIVDRTPHTSPSAYLPMGQDATVDFGHKDLVLKNSTDSPMYIYMTVDSQSPWHVTASIYGQPLPDGVTINLDSTSEVTDLPALDTWRSEDSQAVDPGEEKIEQPRQGYRINVYIVYYKNGVEYDRKKLDTVTYAATGWVVLYYPGDPKPSQGMTSLPPSTPPTPGPSGPVG